MTPFLLGIRKGGRQSQSLCPILLFQDFFIVLIIDLLQYMNNRTGERTSYDCPDVTQKELKNLKKTKKKTECTLSQITIILFAL